MDEFWWIFDIFCRGWKERQAFILRMLEFWMENGTRVDLATFSCTSGAGCPKSKNIYLAGLAAAHIKIQTSHGNLFFSGRRITQCTLERWCATTPPFASFIWESRGLPAAIAQMTVCCSRSRITRRIFIDHTNSCSEDARWGSSATGGFLAWEQGRHPHGPHAGWSSTTFVSRVLEVLGMSSHGSQWKMAPIVEWNDIREDVAPKLVCWRHLPNSSCLARRCCVFWI